MKIVHAADIHLDSPMLGLERYEGAPVDVLRGATRKAFSRLIDLCLEEQARLLLLAGDLFDGDWKDYGTGLFFLTELGRLAQAALPMRVVLLRGNHDAQSVLTKQLVLPEHVKELPTGTPGSLVFEELGVAIHGQGFAERAVSRDLTPEYPAPVPGLFNVGLLHTCLDDRPGHANYAPSSTQALVHHGYDYWALGHIHSREIVNREPWIVYPGNLQGRHMRECGPKGATLIEVEAGRVRSVEHRELCVVRWEKLELDASDLEDPEELLVSAGDRLSELQAEITRPIAVRITIVGRSRLHAQLASDPDRWLAEFRRVANDVGDVWLERLDIATRARIDLSELRALGGPMGQLANSLEALRQNPAELSELCQQLAELERRIPRELRDGPDALHLTDPETAAQELTAIEQLLLPMLFDAERG
ncbi:MAG: DNA repair exonuclease [Polyangiaceae bacterium]|nr:DNA repair exonuclease [Polyangiaceae bacterium]MCB9606929.1 DNA repair exonuclease [Polyangiaceae bacterium]